MEELWKVAGSALIMSLCISIYQSIKKHSDKKNHIQESDYNDYEKDFFEELKRKNDEYDQKQK